MVIIVIMLKGASGGLHFLVAPGSVIGSKHSCCMARREDLNL